MNFFLSILSGILLILSFPKFDLYWLAWVALTPLIISIYKSKTLAQALFCGIISFSIYFGGTLYWVTTLSNWAGIYGYLSWVGLTIFQCIFFIPFIILLKISHEKKSIFIAPAIWVLSEFLKTNFSFGVFGAVIGYTQYQLLPLIQMSDITGVYGLSFIIVLVNNSLANLFLFKRWKEILITALIVILAFVYGFTKLFHPYKSTESAAIIQANISQKFMLDRNKLNYIFEKYKDLSNKAIMKRPKIIIWPEGAVPTYIYKNKNLYDITSKFDGYLIFGTPYIEENKNIYNSVMAISKSKKNIGRYDKQYLVPFGEYIPFRNIFYPYLKDFNLFENEFTPNPSPKLITIGDMNIGIAVCFESLFPEIIRKRTLDGANILLVVTNDAWFGSTSALYQHFFVSIFRAIENRRYLLQAANTGISAIIDPCGKTIRTQVNEETILFGKFQRNDNITFYSKFGDIFVYLCFLLIIYWGIKLFRQDNVSPKSGQQDHQSV